MTQKRTVFFISSFVLSSYSVVGQFIAFISDICRAYLFYICLSNFLCFMRAAIIAPGVWLSCSTRLDTRAVSLLDVSNK